MNYTIIELWLDLSCPWCQGALPVMKQLLLDEAPQASVQWRPTRLHPMPPEGIDYREAMSKYTQEAEKLAAMRAELEKFNTDRGRVLDLDKAKRLHHPRLAHALLDLAREDGGVDMWALAERLWDANWAEGADIARLESLREAVGSLVPESLWEQLARGGGVEFVDADRARAQEIGLDGVPRFYLNGKIVPAWLDVAVVRAKLREALA